MKTATADDLINLWQTLGIVPGMTVLCHTFLPSVGRIQGGPDALVDTLLDAVGPGGTLIAPTFTYSYFKGEIFDVDATPSSVGVLGDVLRRRPGAVRSLDPNFSNVAVGAAAENLMRRDTKHSFGPDSFYDKFLNADGRVLLLGVDFTALPLFMHLERTFQLPYRYDKTFFGTTRSGGQTYEDSSVHYVRDATIDPRNNRGYVGAMIDRDPTSRNVFFGYGAHRFVPASTVARITAEALSAEPNALITLLGDDAS